VAVPERHEAVAELPRLRRPCHGTGQSWLPGRVDAINAYDGDAYDAGAMARSELVLAHLDLWKRWFTSGGGLFGRKFVGKVDLRNVGLMGHSRGGEGVARAAVLNSQRGGK
jgi:hypothetical protein